MDLSCQLIENNGTHEKCDTSSQANSKQVLQGLITKLFIVLYKILTTLIAQASIACEQPTSEHRNTRLIPGTVADRAVDECRSTEDTSDDQREGEYVDPQVGGERVHKVVPLMVGQLVHDDRGHLPVREQVVDHFIP